MEETSGPFALVSSPGHTNGLDSRNIIEEVLDEAGLLIEQDPEHEVPGYRDRELPQALQWLRSLPPEALRAPDEEWDQERHEDRIYLLERATVAVIDFTHDEDRASPSLELALSIRPERGSTIAVSQQKQRLSLPEGASHIAYRTRPDLARLLRKELGLSQPLHPEQLGFAIVFRAPEATFGLLDLLLPQALLTAFRAVRFTGRCECYMLRQKTSQTPELVLALALRENTRRLHKSYDWWQKLQAEFLRAVAAQNADATFIPALSGFSRVGEMRLRASPQGAADFDSGIPSRVLCAHEPCRWFEEVALQAVAKNAPPGSEATSARRQ